eukprot:1177004-Prorocentrum_minimum.AAC.3
MPRHAASYADYDDYDDGYDDDYYGEGCSMVTLRLPISFLVTIDHSALFDCRGMDHSLGVKGLGR